MWITHRVFLLKNGNWLTYSGRSGSGGGSSVARKMSIASAKEVMDSNGIEYKEKRNRLLPEEKEEYERLVKKEYEYLKNSWRASSMTDAEMMSNARSIAKTQILSDANKHAFKSADIVKIATVVKRMNDAGFITKKEFKGMKLVYDENAKYPHTTLADGSRIVFTSSLKYSFAQNTIAHEFGHFKQLTRKNKSLIEATRSTDKYTALVGKERIRSVLGSYALNDHLELYACASGVKYGGRGHKTFASSEYASLEINPFKGVDTAVTPKAYSKMNKADQKLVDDILKMGLR